MEAPKIKGSELNNVQETWDRNEKALQANGGEALPEPATDATTDIEKLIKKEAGEYDQINKEERTLGGDRATINDDETTA